MSFSFLLIGLAGLASLAAWIWLIATAFQSGQKAWGIILIVSVFIPLVGPFLPLIYIIQNWGIARKPAFLYLGSLAVAVLGFLLGLAEFRRATEELAATARDSGTALVTRGGDEADEMPVRQDAAEKAPAQAPSEPTPPPRPPQPPPRSQAEVRPAPPKTALQDSPPIVPAEVARPDPAPLKSPLEVDLVRLGEPGPNAMRKIVARARNTAPHAVKETKLALSYFDARGLRLGRWTTIHSESTNVVGATMTNEFSVQAFFVPQFTRDVRIEVEFVKFANGDRWPPIDPTLKLPTLNRP